MLIFFFIEVQGGEFGPYTQSERLHFYKEFVEKLVSEGHAYLCFCSDRRLEFVKKEAEREGRIPKYDNRCRYLSRAEADEKKRQGTPWCIRFKASLFSLTLLD